MSGPQTERIRPVSPVIPKAAADPVHPVRRHVASSSVGPARGDLTSGERGAGAHDPLCHNISSGTSRRPRLMLI